MKPSGLASLQKRARNVSLRAKIMGIVVCIILFLGLSVTAIARNTLRKVLFAELDARGLMLARDLAAHTMDFVLTEDLFSIHRMIVDMRSHNSEIAYILVLNQRGLPLDHTLPGPPSPSLLTANQPSPPATSQMVRLLTTAGTVRDIAVPLLGGHSGTVRLGWSEKSVQQEITRTTSRLLFATLLASLVGMALAILLTGVLVRPIRELVEVTRIVGQGDYSRSATIYAEDEIGQLAQDFNSMTSSLLRSQQELRRKDEIRTQLLQKVITAQEEERKRVARELHDRASQSLTSLMVGLKVLESTYPYGDATDGRSKAQDQLGNLRSLLTRTLEEIHDIAGELRPSAFDDLGLTEALRRLSNNYSEKFSFIVDFHCEGYNRGRLPQDAETAIYRIVQEALANVARHAGASNVSVLLDTRESSLLAIVEDDGCGFDAQHKITSHSEESPLGLFGMMERASLIGGRLTVESAQNEGTTIFLEVPLLEGV